MLGLSIASDVINTAFVVMQAIELGKEVIAYNKFQKV
jgi:hypothetical protein